eukprot:scaffold5033_cov106-Isochrysis_galbana.AAC.1
MWCEIRSESHLQCEIRSGREAGDDVAAVLFNSGEIGREIEIAPRSADGETVLRDGPPRGDVLVATMPWRRAVRRCCM